ncbi:hypothetical protein PGTUg99_016675 [Puccinia graminis f. sp. tritici]|uniref:Uncharacterized protein n=1 Tax=Puccinia graminis f. sp. tritici TaxID=56615 RepID=A0A5B0R5Y8_PUCGR|nr:hypothetical protein PGTUg99_016675 [Puccinia graminis f. sp. tritici]
MAVTLNQLRRSPYNPPRRQSINPLNFNSAHPSCHHAELTTGLSAESFTSMGFSCQLHMSRGHQLAGNFSLKSEISSYWHLPPKMQESS